MFLVFGGAEIDIGDMDGLDMGSFVFFVVEVLPKTSAINLPNVHFTFEKMRLVEL